MEDFGEARRLYELALQAEPGHAGIRWNLGILAETQGRFDEAGELFTGVVAAQPGWKEATMRQMRLRPGSR
jgi:Flp pilus assembly protein TadD